MKKLNAVRTISMLWIGSLLGAGFAFFTQVILARTLTIEDFGIFSAVLVTTTLIVPLAGFGVPQFWLKVFGEEGVVANRWLNSSFQFILGSTALVLASLTVWALLGPHDDRTTVTILLLLVYVAGQVAVELVSSRFQLEERYQALFAWQLTPHGVRFLLITLCWVIVPTALDAHWVALIFSSVSTLLLIAAFNLLASMWRGRISLPEHTAQVCEAPIKDASIVEVIQGSYPYGISGVFYLLYFQSAIVLLNYLSGESSAALYNVAFIIMAAAYLLPSAIYQKFLLPKFHRWAARQPELLAESFKVGNVYMTWLGIATTMIIWLCSTWAVPLLFGDTFQESVTILNILALSAPVRFVASSVGALLVTKNNMRHKIRCMGLVALFNLTLNLLAIPYYGPVGAAVVTVVSDALLLAAYYTAVRRYVFL